MYMKRMLLLVAIVFTAGFLGVWALQSDKTFQTPVSDTSQSQNDKPVVVASIFPLYDIVRIVGGEEVEAILLLPPGSSPHTFDPIPSTLRKVTDAQKVFMIGHQLDMWAEDLANSAGNVDVVVVDTSISLQENVNHHGHDEHHEEENFDEWVNLEEEYFLDVGHDQGEIDPHYWLNPENAGIIATTVANELSKVYPEHAQEFASRAQAFSKDIESRSAAWKQQIAALGDHVDIITFHDAFGYFAKYFDIHVVATVEPFAGKEPTPQYLKELRDTIQAQEASALFLEPQLSSDAIRSFAQDTGIPVGVLDPIGGVEGRNSYIELISYNVQTIVETLSRS